MDECVILSSDEEPEIIEIKDSLISGTKTDKVLKTSCFSFPQSEKSSIKLGLVKDWFRSPVTVSSKGVTPETNIRLIPRKKYKSSAPSQCNELSTKSATSVKHVKTPNNNQVSIELRKRVSVSHIDQSSPVTSKPILSKLVSKSVPAALIKSVSAPVRNRETAGPSCSQKSQPLSKEEKKRKDASDNAEFICREEKEVKALFKKLLGLRDEVDKSEDMTSIKNRLWRYYSEASPEYLCCDSFKSLLNEEIKRCTSKELKHNPLLSLKKVLEALKANPYLATKKLRKLQRMLEKVQKIIGKLEASEVSSDEESNVYVQLDRYNRRAVQIYNKICELMDKPADAERQYLRKVSFSGSGTNQVICRALEKYFNKTRKFPDFFDVKSLVSATNEKESLDLSPAQIHSTAEKIFLEFGTMLQRRRCYDDYSIMVEYINEDSHDPALNDPELMRKLNENKRLYHKRENQVLEEYAIKELNHKKKNATSKDNNNQSKKQEDDENENERDDESGDNCSSDESEDEKIEEEESGGLKTDPSDEEEEHSAKEEERVGSSLDSEDELDLPSKRIKLDSTTIPPDIVKTKEIYDPSIDKTKEKNNTVKNVSKVNKEAVTADSKESDIEIIETVDNSTAFQLKSNEQVDSKRDSLNHSLKYVNEKPKKTEAAAEGSKMVIDLEDDLIDLTGEEKLPYITPSADVDISSTSNAKLNNTSFKGEGKCVPIVFEGKHPLIITEQSTIFISRAAKIFKRLDKKPINNDVITID